ncbi:YitT family protein [Miniimonas sp. S16]|uniref:membrane protein YczE n=1 Tax=Miniimonas sp. S16 TaxID=2171623 RepID=UPI001F1E9925|nr:hypothetical protein [Miniimonas sp. S16]
MRTVLALVRHPVDQLREPGLGRRLPQLLAGLVLYGFSMAMMVRAGLGLDPWDVLHQGVARRTGLSFGTVVILVGAAVLLAWIPLRQRVGVGTLCNVVVIGVAADAGLAVLPPATGWAARIVLLVLGVVLNALAGALYVGAHLGPGPRDGLWVAIAARSGWSVRAVRTVIEVSVLAIGFVLGGSVGVGTVLYALAIGPLVQLFLPLVSARRSAGSRD